MAEPAPDKNVLNEKKSESSLPERDTDDISVDLVDETDINQRTSIFPKIMSRIYWELSKIRQRLKVRSWRK